MREYATKRAYKFRRFMRNAGIYFWRFLGVFAFVVLSVCLDSLIVLANELSDYGAKSLSIPNDSLYLFQFAILLVKLCMRNVGIPFLVYVLFETNYTKHSSHTQSNAD